jgi:restriction system protein
VSTKSAAAHLEVAYQSLRKTLAQDLLDRIKTCSPKFFETLVVDLLVAIGYGGSRKDAGQAVRRSGDDGIDGISKKTGLDSTWFISRQRDGKQQLVGLQFKSSQAA